MRNTKEAFAKVELLSAPAPRTLRLGGRSIDAGIENRRDAVDAERRRDLNLILIWNLAGGSRAYRVFSTPILAILALLFFGVTTITAAPGDLDPTFGNGGIALAYSSQYQFYSAYAMAIQPDGKIVVVGEGVGSSHGANWESAVVRFNPDGSLDTSLGGTGIVIDPVGRGFYSVAIQPDGNIVVVSSVAAGTFAVVRYNPNGSLDTTFKRQRHSSHSGWPR